MDYLHYFSYITCQIIERVICACLNFAVFYNNAYTAKYQRCRRCSILTRSPCFERISYSMRIHQRTASVLNART